MNSKCYCYEKFKDALPKGTATKCFREKCKNYREMTKKNERDTREIKETR
jgi:hypothetical protein